MAALLLTSQQHSGHEECPSQNDQFSPVKQSFTLLTAHDGKEEQLQ